MAVAVMFPGDRLQQPKMPVQKAMKIVRKERMNKAIAERPISVETTIKFI